MRLTKIRLITSVLVVVGLVGAVYSYNIHNRGWQISKTESTLGSGGTLQVSTSPNNQTISLYSPSQNSASSTPTDQANSNQATTYNQNQQTSSSGSSHYAENLAIINGLSTKTTPMPDFDYGRPSPTLNTTYTPPASSCTYVAVSGSTKTHYACPYGSYPPCSPYKAVAPYDYTKNLYECS